MTYSDSSDASSSASASAASLLQAGLAALKQKDYSTAIAHLRQCQSADPPTRWKAQMGLAKAYLHTQQLEPAQQICQTLQTQPNPQVQDWARQTLQEIARRRSPPPQPPQPIVAADPTGFTPTSKVQPPAASGSIADATGFVPLRSAAQTNDSDQSGVPSSNAAADRSGQTAQSRPADEISLQSPIHPAAQPTAIDPNSQADSPAALPTAPSSPQDTPTPIEPSSLQPIADRWRNAGRSSKWTSLGRVDVSSLWALEVGSIVLLFWLMRTSCQILFGTWNWFSIRLNWLTRLPRLILPTDLTVFFLIGIVVLLVASPWLLRGLLQAYPIQSLSLAELEQISPESVRLLKRWSQRRQPIPTLERLNLAVPMIFSIGHSPWTTRIVLSQGLFDQLAPDEIATLIAAELGHIRYWDIGAMTLIAALAQIPYQIYWRVANWGDRRRDRVLQTLAVLISSIAYGLFWLLRLPGVGLARIRLYYSDRLATEATGNPNGLTRALLKLAIGTAQDIQQQQQTSTLLESLEILLPVGYRSGLTIGSLYRDPAQGSLLLEWERHNPLRRWLAFNNPHPPLGDRLNLLTEYARQWRLESELSWRPIAQRPNRLDRATRSRLLLQGAPFFGIPIGVGVGMLLWVVGWLARQVRLFELDWLAGDRSLLWACGLLGFSIGLFLRINPSFPDITRSTVQQEPDLERLMQPVDSLPIDSAPVRLSGQLIGRPGFQNWLYRDLMLQTANGVIRLHYTSPLGWLSDLLPQALRPTRWIDRPVTVTGWFRRGATPWIDVETIQVRTATGQIRTAGSQHPLLSTLLASLAALLAVWLIFRGG